MTNNLRELATTELSISQMTLEETFVKLTYEALNDIKNKFVEIGFRLREANQLKYYARLGYDSIEDLAEDLFDIKRSSVYQLIAINEKFCSSKRWLEPRYEKFSQSQLVEMLPIADSWLCMNISPDCTVAEIREYKKAVSYKGHNDYCYGPIASRHTVQNIIEKYHKAMTDDEKVQTSGQNPDVLPGQTSIFDESEEESYDWRKDYNSKEWREHHYSSLLFDTTDDPNFKAAIINANTEVLLKARKNNGRMTAIKKIEAELKRRGVEFDKDGLDEEIYDGYALDEQKEKECIEREAEQCIEREAEQDFPDNACIPCYGKNLEDMFILTDDVGKTVYFPGFKFCPYCGRKLYPRFTVRGANNEKNRN